MLECPPFDYLMVLPRLRVQNANAISSPLTHGFPSMTAFLGLMWALERKVQAQGLDVQFNAVSVVAHDYGEQIHKSGYTNSFHLTRNPMGKDGKPAAIVEEGRIHLEISLVFAIRGSELREPSRAQEVAEQVSNLVSSMRVAGGTVLPGQHRRWQAPYIEPFTGDAQTQRQMFNRLKMRLLPGFVLVERSDLLEQRLIDIQKTEQDATRLDAWLSLSRVNWTWEGSENNAEGRWLHDRQGWLVPITLGYGALTELQAPGSVANARDSTTSFCFVESVYGIGQWLSPHRVQSAEQMLWYPDSQPNEGLYRCRNDYRSEETPEFEYDFD
ncbi:type I-F CRISPR-associated protein Csy2 [Marinimicrobium sp. ARAG 43.8]|uniref:type I-F CRISPR-associated protein Csy2 n=1 Tax=Marinimicrobium sp. ARAG 43.8 TaxID=3418719 RepID=UPI003CF8F995